RHWPLPAACRCGSPARCPAAPMTPPVSTSCGDWLCGLLGECGGGAVPGGVVGDAFEPAGPDDADPGAGEDADGVRVVLAAGAGVAVDLAIPWKCGHFLLADSY